MAEKSGMYTQLLIKKSLIVNSYDIRNMYSLTDKIKGT